MNITVADKFIGNLRYRDMKKECVIRGMDFDKVIEGSIPGLTNWLRAHFNNTSQYELLDIFDDYQENLIKGFLKEKGKNEDFLIHPSLRLGYIAEKDEDGNVIKRKRVKTIVKKKKHKRERTSQGIFSGTKKALTYQLQKEGLDKKEVVKKVLEEYPDASIKSIGIWFNKSRKNK